MRPRPSSVMGHIGTSSEAQPLHPLLGAVCQSCHNAWSAPLTKTSSLPSWLLPTVSCSTTPPSDAHPLHPLFGAVCQICHKALSMPRAKTSSLPSWFEPTVSRSMMPPNEAHPLQPL